MPLRDHFHPPVSKRGSWEGFHGMWPGVIVQQLHQILPVEYAAEPRVRLGTFCEIDLCAFEHPEPQRAAYVTSAGSGGVATVAWAPPEPTLAVDMELAEEYEYEVLVYDQELGRILVAAIEFVSPANKDRPKSRQAFVTKCAALRQQSICVSIVDLVTTSDFNLYAELLATLDQSDPAFGPQPPNIYAATCHRRKLDRVSRLESWAYPLVVGQPLPTLPVWLSDDLAISLDLETSYEETCRLLRIG